MTNDHGSDELTTETKKKPINSTQIGRLHITKYNVYNLLFTKRKATRNAIERSNWINKV